MPAVKKTSARRVARKPAKKVAAKKTPVAVVKEMPEARVKARERNVESRSRAVAENGAKPNAPRVVLYELKNRATGETRTLIDARGDGAVAEKPWLVTNGTATVGFATRKELGQNYSKSDLFKTRASTPSAKPKARRVKK